MIYIVHHHPPLSKHLYRLIKVSFLDSTFPLNPLLVAFSQLELMLKYDNVFIADCQSNKALLLYRGLGASHSEIRHVMEIISASSCDKIWWILFFSSWINAIIKTKIEFEWFDNILANLPSNSFTSPKVCLKTMLQNVS